MPKHGAPDQTNIIHRHRPSIWLVPRMPGKQKKEEYLDESKDKIK